MAEDTDGQYFGKRADGSLYPIREDRKTVAAVQAETEEDVKRVLADTGLWGEDLSALSGQVYADLCAIRKDPRNALKTVL